eukprot:jgi/Hompol1/2716/HPOL_006141-RA
MGAVKLFEIEPNVDPTLQSSMLGPAAMNGGTGSATGTGAGTGSGAGSNGIAPIIIEAGWGMPSTITGTIRVATAKPLRDAKLTLEFSGVAETSWVGSKVRRPGDPAGEAYVRRFALAAAVVRDAKEPLDSGASGVPLQLPFSIHLPHQGLPPSFDDGRGAIKY